MGRPSKGERVRVVTNLAPDVAAELDALCFRRGADRSEVVAEMVADALAKPQPGDAPGGAALWPKPDDVRRFKTTPPPAPTKKGPAVKAGPAGGGVAPVGYVPTSAPGSRLKKR